MALPFPPRQNTQQNTEDIIQENIIKTPDTAYIIQVPEKPGYYLCALCYCFDSKKRYETVSHVKECLRKKEIKKKAQEDKEKMDTEKLFHLFIQLQKEVSTLRQKIKDMEKQELQKINIPRWLNYHCSEPLPIQTFRIWRKSFHFQPSDEQLQMVFHHNIKKGIQDVIRHVLESEDPSTFPIRAFSKQKHMFYIYDIPIAPKQTEDEQEEPEPEWRKMDKEEFHKWLEFIQYKFLLKFNEWEELNQEWLENETNSQERTKYLEKISIPFDKIEPQTVRNWLYDELKRPLKRIVELEFDDI